MTQDAKTKLLKEFRAKFNIDYKREVSNGWLDNINADDLESFFLTAMEEVEKAAVAKMEKAVHNMPRTIASYSSDHEVIDTCEIYKALQAIKRKSK